MIYNVSCERYSGFRCEIDEETSNKLEGLPGVLFVLPNSYVDSENKDYGRRLLLLFIWLSKAKVLTWLMSLFNQILLWLQLLTERVILLCILQHEKAVYRMNLKVGNLVCLSTVPQSRLWIEPVDRIDIWSNSRSL